LIERMMEPEVQIPVRQALKHLDDAAQVAVVVDFYRKLGRIREADFWETYRKQVARRPPPVTQSVSLQP